MDHTMPAVIRWKKFWVADIGNGENLSWYYPKFLSFRNRNIGGKWQIFFHLFFSIKDAVYFTVNLHNITGN